MGAPRPPQAELLSLPTAGALQSSPALQPLVASVLARWRRHQKVAAADCDLEADEVSELQARAVTCAVACAACAWDAAHTHMHMPRDTMLTRLPHTHATSIP